MDHEANFDALLPSEMARKAEVVGQKKAELDAISTLILGVLAGAFIALGAIFATTVAAGSSALPYGVAKLLTGGVFSLGLILVILGGAELFTGNNLIVMAWASRKVSFAKLMRNWGLVYLGNLIGSVGTALLVHLSGQAGFGGASVGAAMIGIANSKAQLDPTNAFFLGILCNALVCLAVWLSFSARSATDKVLVIIPPIAAFVAAGFEHSIANMYFFAIGLFTRYASSEELTQALGITAASTPDLTLANAFLRNLLPVTLGNIIGGAGLVGAVYWFLYLRKGNEV